MYARVQACTCAIIPSHCSNQFYVFVFTEQRSGGSHKRKLAFHEPRPCPQCQRIYRDAATLRTHVTIMHKAGAEPFVCTCGALFDTKYHMYTHRKNGHK